MRRMLSYFTSRAMITNWIILVIMAAGVFSLFQLQKRVWPRLEISAVRVQITWPGASAREIEQALTVKIENSLKGIEGIENSYSTTGDEYVNFYLETGRNASIETVIDKVKSRIDQISDYPEEARKPRVYQEDSWNRVMLLFIYGPEDPEVLQDIADQFKEDLLASDTVSQINNWGLPGKNLVLEVMPEELDEYGLTVDSLSAMIQSYSRNGSAGALITAEENLMIRTYNERTDLSELASIPITLSGKDGPAVHPLGNLFTLKEEWPKDAVYHPGKRKTGHRVSDNVYKFGRRSGNHRNYRHQNPGG